LTPDEMDQPKEEKKSLFLSYDYNNNNDQSFLKEGWRRRRRIEKVTIYSFHLHLRKRNHPQILLDCFYEK